MKFAAESMIGTVLSMSSTRTRATGASVAAGRSVSR